MFAGSPAAFPSRTATIVIAASDTANPAGADFVCTGTADQTVINAAIKLLYSTTYGGLGNPSTGSWLGGRIILRNGTYNITDSIVIDGSWIALEGEGPPFWGRYIGPYSIGTAAGAEGFAGAKIKATAALATGTGLIQIGGNNLPDNSEGRHRCIRLKSLYLYGFNFSNTGIYDAGGTDSCIAEDICVQNTTNGINVRWDNGTIFNCNIQSISGNAYTITVAGGCRLFGNCAFDIGGICVSLSGAATDSPGVLCHSNGLGDCLGDCIHPAGGGHVIVNNSIFGHAGSAIQIANGQGITCNNNNINNKGNQPAPTDSRGIYVLGGVTYSTISGNTLIATTTTSGQAIDACGLNTNSLNVIKGNSVGGGWNQNRANRIAYGDVSNIVGDNVGETAATLYSATFKSASLIGWWKADALALSNGNSVTSWSDSSGGGITLTTGTSAPVYHTGIQNSLPGVLFTRSGSTGNQLKNVSFGTMPQPITALVVCNPSTFSAVSGDTLYDPINLNGLGVICDTTGKVGIFAGGVALTTITATFGNAQIWEVVALSTTSLVGINGAAPQTLNPSTNGTSGTFFLGANVSYEYFNGYIFEVLVFKGYMNATERAVLGAALASKWGITCGSSW